MDRQDDVRELLSEIDKNLEFLKGKYAKAQADDGESLIGRPLIKTILSDLRSVLDYCAQSIYESYSKKKGRPQFPYGEDEPKFVLSVKKYLNGLATQNSEVYSLVEGLQPHKAGNNWLYVMCSMTNVTKHKDLGRQRREDSEFAKISIGQHVHLSGGATINFYGTRVDGVVVGSSTVPVKVGSTRSLEEIKRDFPHINSVKKESDWVKFKFEDHDADALELLETARDEIRVFVGALQKLI